MEWGPIMEKSACVGNPCDFVAEYRLLLREAEKGGAPEGLAGRWESFWHLMLLAAEIATGRRPPAGNQWRLRFGAAPEGDEAGSRISLIGEKGIAAARAAASFSYPDMEKFPADTRPTPQARMVVLAHWFCCNFRKDPRLILRADRLELDVLRAAALEFTRPL